jgi:hypothetical protein
VTIGKSRNSRIVLSLRFLQEFRTWLNVWLCLEDVFYRYNIWLFVVVAWGRSALPAKAVRRHVFEFSLPTAGTVLNVHGDLRVFYPAIFHRGHLYMLQGGAKLTHGQTYF